jgi:hypothetical protein
VELRCFYQQKLNCGYFANTETAQQCTGSTASTESSKAKTPEQQHKK